jgi:hypothetical protein
MNIEHFLLRRNDILGSENNHYYNNLNWGGQKRFFEVGNLNASDQKSRLIVALVNQLTETAI